MTREQLDESFIKFRKGLVGHARKLTDTPDNAEDIVNAAYIKALETTTYEKVDPILARSWWYFKIRTIAHRGKKRGKKVKQAEEKWSEGLEDGIEQEYTEGQAQQVAEEHWNSLTRVQQSRMRQKYRDEGLAIFPFMRKKKGV